MLLCYSVTLLVCYYTVYTTAVLITMTILTTQVIVPEEKNSMLLGAAMLGMAAGEEEGLEAVVRKLQKISKVTDLYNTGDFVPGTSI